MFYVKLTQSLKAVSMLPAADKLNLSLEIQKEILLESNTKCVFKETNGKISLFNSCSYETDVCHLLFVSNKQRFTDGDVNPRQKSRFLFQTC